MATFHIRRQGVGYVWTLVTNEDRVLARGPGIHNTKGEAIVAVSEVRRELVGAETVVDTTVPESRWRGIDIATGEIQSDPAPESEETHDEGETGPPEVDLTEPPKGLA